jgi:hypothetical protein
VTDRERCPEKGASHLREVGVNIDAMMTRYLRDVLKITPSTATLGQAWQAMRVVYTELGRPDWIAAIRTEYILGKLPLP